MNLDWSIVWRSLPALLQGTELTITLAVATMALSIPGGILLALMRLSSWRALSLLSACITELLRNVPLLLVVYAAYYLLPILLDVSFSPFATGLVPLTLSVSAYNGETFRAGIVSIPSGQTQAALAIGMSPWQAMWQVVLPQAVRRVTPILASTWVSLFKDTSLVSFIAVPDLAYAALRIRSESLRVLELLTAMGALYWLLGYPQAKLVDWIHRRFAMSE